MENKFKKYFKKASCLVIAVAMLGITLIKAMPFEKNENTAYVGESKVNLATISKVQSNTLSNWCKYMKMFQNGWGVNSDQKYQFIDGSKNFRDIYCIQPGTSQSNMYQANDIYTLNQTQINQLFQDQEHYEHFVWMVENLYVSNMDVESERNSMTEDFLKRLGGTAELTNLYNKMNQELIEAYRKQGFTVSDQGVVTWPYYNYYASGTSYGFYVNLPEDEASKVKLDGRENFIRTIQNYMLYGDVIQKDGKLGRTLVDEGLDNLHMYTLGYSAENGRDIQITKADIDQNSSYKAFASKIVDYFANGYDKNSYDINKYRNFGEASYDGNVVINKESAKVQNNKVGPFYITNKYGFDVKVATVRVNDEIVSNANVVCNENLSAKGLSNKEFYIDLNGIDLSGKRVSVDFSVDYGEVPTAFVMTPNGDNRDGIQILLSVDKKHVTDTISWSVTTTETTADLALKKYIYSVNGNVVENRLGSIDLSTIESQKNATYQMNKTPIKVELGDKVTFALQLFNEGSVEGTATSITDYLPLGLTFNKAYMAGVSELSYEYGSTKQEVKIELPSENALTDYIQAYSVHDTEETFKAKSKTVYVECTVSSLEQGTYTNIAEISGYVFKAGEDRDSQANNWKIEVPGRDEPRTYSVWKDYKGAESNQASWVTDNKMHAFLGQQDDDDFDKLVTDHVDLALTKSMFATVAEDGSLVRLQTADNQYKDSIEITGADKLKSGMSSDLAYNMNKVPAKVKSGDYVAIKLTVYNEGNLDGVVKEIKDYLPQGLEFDSTRSAILNKGKDVSFEYNHEKNVVYVVINRGPGITLQKFENVESLVEGKGAYSAYVVAKVLDNASGKLYNSAAITSYGYNSKSGEYVPAIEIGVDDDSAQRVSDYHVLRQTHQSNYLKVSSESNMSNVNKTTLQVEDDDDMDCVEVDFKQRFDLSLRKFVYKVANGTTGEVSVYNNRVPTLTSGSLAQLNERGTASYIHEKLKVAVNKGDKVTYRIRVYNEGTEGDYSGIATQITDYLPRGLKYVDIESEYKNEWTLKEFDEQNNILRFSYTGNKVLNPDSIKNLVERKLCGSK